MNDLILNVDKLHTTKLGIERINRNVKLQSLEVISWCQNAVENADYIMRKGKNWYVYKDGIAITVNAHSYTIITAHKINPKIRDIEESDYDMLNEFLYQAIYVPEGNANPPRKIIEEPEIAIYIKGFGSQKGDLGVVADQNGFIIGAAWTRIINAYGSIDDETPELAISVLPEFRECGTGTKLMSKLFKVLQENNYKRTSLSVQKSNEAVKFYKRLGYIMARERIDNEDLEDYLMIKELF